MGVAVPSDVLALQHYLTTARNITCPEHITSCVKAVTNDYLPPNFPLPLDGWCIVFPVLYTHGTSGWWLGTGLGSILHWNYSDNAAQSRKNATSQGWPPNC